MAAILLSSDEFAQQLEEVGMPRAQAVVVAKGLAAMYVHNFDSLVTKDYLDTRFLEFESRMGRELDQRFAQIDQRFASQDARFERRFNDIETRFARVNVMLAVILAAVAVPIFQSLAA